MAQYIEVNGEVVEFPDNMSDADIAKALQNNQQPPKDSISSGFLMGLKDPISGGAQLLPRGLEFVTSAGGSLPNPVSKFFGSEAQRVDEMVKQEEQAYQQSRQAQGESGFDWARLGGNVFNPANVAGAAGAARLATAGAKPLAVAAGAGAGTGVLQPVYNTEEFGTEKTKQGAAGAVGGLAGKKVTDVAGNVLNPLVSKAEQTMRDLGVRLTPGQLAGGQVKTIEEFAENMPLVGKFIANAKEKQLFQFNQGVINKALNKIDDKLPDAVIGRDAVNYAFTKVGDQYDDVLKRISFEINPNVNAALRSVTSTSKLSSGAEKQKLNDLMNTYIYSRIPVGKNKVGTIDGQAFKGLESDLLKRVKSLRSSSDDSDRVVGEELGRALDVIKVALRSQNPKEASKLRRIDSAYGDLAVMREAAGKTAAKNGVFTPQQYQQAVRTRDQTRSKSAFAAGTSRGQDVADAAVDTISPDVGSTITGRLALGTAGGYAFTQNPTAVSVAAISTPLMYSQQGLKVMEALMRSRPEIARQIGRKLSERATKEGSIGGAEIMEEYNRVTRTK
jgi:hypothetical protein